MTIPNVIDRLNEFLRGEISAVQAYDAAIKSVHDASLLGSLRMLRESHADRVEVLHTKVDELGGVPDQTSGAWGAFASVVQTGADLLGDGIALAALESGEDHGLKMYSHLHPEQEAVLKMLVASTLMPAQQQSHELCRALKRHLRAA